MFRTSDDDGWGFRCDCHWILSLSEFCFLERIKRDDGVIVTKAEKERCRRRVESNWVRKYTLQKVKRKKLHSLISHNDHLVVSEGLLVFSFFFLITSFFLFFFLQFERHLQKGCGEGKGGGQIDDGHITLENTNRLCDQRRRDKQTEECE